MTESPTRRSRPRDAGAVALLIVLLAFIHRDLILDTHHIPYDYDTYHWPLFSEVASRVANRQDIGWDTSEYGGAPLLTNVNAAVFYPPHLAILLAVRLTRLRVTLREFAFVELSHWVLLAVTSFIYLRVRGVARRWTVVSTGILLGSGALLSQSQHLGVIEIVSWLPLALLATEHAVDRRTALSGALLGLVLATMLTAGFLPQFVACLLFLMTWALVRVFQTGAPPTRVLLVLAEGLVTALCYGAVIVLPLLHDRATYPQVDAPAAFPVQVLKTTFAPDALGHLEGDPARYVNPTDITWSYYYIGAFAVVAGLASLLTRERSARGPQVVLIVLVLAGFGQTADALAGIARSLPAVGQLYRASPVPVLLCFATWLLLAQALQRGRWPRAVILLTMVLISGGLLLTHAQIGSETARVSAWSMPAVAWIILGASTVALLSQRPTLVLAVAVAGVIELVVVNSGGFWFSSPGPAQRWDERHVTSGYDAALAFLQQDKGQFRVAVDQAVMTDTWDNGWRVWGLDSISGFDPQHNGAWVTLAEHLGARQYAAPRRFSLDQLSSGVLQIFNIKYLVWRAGTVPPLPPGLTVAFTDDLYSIVRVATFRPRVYLTSLSCATVSAAFEQTSSRCRDVIRVQVRLSTAGHLDVDLPSGHGAGLLVTGTAAFPGWRAAVDGVSRGTRDAFGAVQAVNVEAGDERVVLDYRPVSTPVGLSISAASLSGLMILALYSQGPLARRRQGARAGRTDGSSSI